VYSVYVLSVLQGGGDIDDIDIGDGSDLLSDNTARLSSAISSLPELIEKKKNIDKHTNIATALLDEIKVSKLTDSS